MFLNLIKSVFCASLLAVSVSACAFTVGEDYEKVPRPSMSKFEKPQIIEIFSYGCPHCHDFDPILEKWLQANKGKVEFSRASAFFNPQWESLGRLGVVMDKLGVAPKLHSKLFQAVHVQKLVLNTDAKTIDWLVSQGVDRKAVNDTWKSFAVEMEVNKQKAMLSKYELTGVPALIVNDRWIISPGKAKGFDNMIKLLDELKNK